MPSNSRMPDADLEIQLEELLPDLDNLNADDRMVVITLIRHTVPRLTLSRILTHLQSTPDHARSCILRLISKRAIRVLDLDDPRTMICVSLSPLSNTTVSDYRSEKPKWYPLVLIDDLPGVPPPYLTGSLSRN